MAAWRSLRNSGLFRYVSATITRTLRPLATTQSYLPVGVPPVTRAPTPSIARLKAPPPRRAPRDVKRAMAGSAGALILCLDRLDRAHRQHCTTSRPSQARSPPSHFSAMQALAWGDMPARPAIRNAGTHRNSVVPRAASQYIERIEHETTLQLAVAILAVAGLPVVRQGEVCDRPPSATRPDSPASETLKAELIAVMGRRTSAKERSSRKRPGFVWAVEAAAHRCCM